MLGISHAVEVLVLGLLAYKIPDSCCIFNTRVVVACVILLTVSLDVVDIGPQYFVVFLCVYIYMFDWLC